MNLVLFKSPETCESLRSMFWMKPFKKQANKLLQSPNDEIEQRSVEEDIKGKQIIVSSWAKFGSLT